MTDTRKLRERLLELSKAATKGPAGYSEFAMSIPARPDRDADFVLLQAADVIRQLEEDNATLTKALYTPCEVWELSEYAREQRLEVTPDVYSNEYLGYFPPPEEVTAKS